MSPQLTRRKLLTSISAAALGLPLAGLATSCALHTADSAPNPNAITIGYVPIACTTPLIIADAQGLFTERGLAVTLRKYAGWADLWSAYSTGEIDVAHMLSPMPIAINAGATNGQRPTEIAFTQNTNGQAITLASRHIDRVKTAEDFKGMVIGIPFEFSVHALLLRDFLSAHGVSPTSDVELRLLRPSDMIAQLHIGGIDGFVGPEPFNQRAVATGVGRIFTLTKKLWDGHPCCSIAIAKQWRATHPSQADALIDALTTAAAFANDPAHNEAVAEILAEEKYLNQPAKLILPALTGAYTNWRGEEVTDHQRLQFGGATDPTAITWMATQIARWNLGGQRLVMDDPTLIRLADSVLPESSTRSGTSLSINGRVFDPNLPTHNYEENLR